MSPVPRVCPSSGTLECHSYWIPTSVSAKEKNHRQNMCIVCMYQSVLHVLFLFYFLAAQQNDSYLAVKHLITCHVIELHSVQVISAKHQRTTKT